MSFLETIKQVLMPGASYPMVTLFPGGPIGNDVGLNPAAVPGGGAVPEPPTPAVPEITNQKSQTTNGKADTSLRGAVGTANFAGFLRDLGEYNPIMEGRDAFLIYEKMRRSDADVRAALMACKLPIRAAESQIVPGVKENEPGYRLAVELAEFAKENLFGGLESPTSTGTWATQNFETVKENALLCLDFGCAAHEDLWHIDGDKVRLRKLAPRLPYTFYRYHVDNDGETLLFLEQYGYRGNNFVNVLVPAEKIAYFVNEMEGAYFYGRSILRAAYQHWYMKSQIYRIDCIAIERNGLGVPTIKQGPNVSAEDRKAAQQWVQMLSAHEQTGLSLPNGWEFLLTGVSGRVRDPASSIQHHSEMIMRSVLANFLTLGTTQSGSRALGGSMRDFFYLSLEAISRKIDETITNTSIRRLIDYNYDLPSLKTKVPNPKALYPRLTTGNILVCNPLELIAAAKDAAAANVDLLQPDDDTENWIRRKVGLPLKSKVSRARWAPIVTRIQDMQTGVAPLEPGTKPEDEAAAQKGSRGPLPGIRVLPGAAGGQSAGGQGGNQNAQQQATAPESGGKPPHSKAAASESVILSEARDLALSAAAKPLVAPRAHPSPFFKEGDPEHLRFIYPHEAHVDFPAHWKALRGAESQIAGALRTERSPTIRAAARQMAAGLVAGKKPGNVIFETRPHAAVALERILDPLYQAGGQAVRDEHARIEPAIRAAAFGRTVQSQESKVESGRLLLSTLDFQLSTPKRSGGFFADLAAQFFDSTISNDAENAGIEALQKYGPDITDQDPEDLAGELYDAIADNSDAYCDTIADSAARGSFRAGRSDAFDEIRQELAKQGYDLKMIRICAMEKASCDSCRDASGQALAPGEDITDIHEGPAETCECEAVESI